MNKQLGIIIISGIGTILLYKGLEGLLNKLGLGNSTWYVSIGLGLLIMYFLWKKI